MTMEPKDLEPPSLNEPNEPKQDAQPPEAAPDERPRLGSLDVMDGGYEQERKDTSESSSSSAAKVTKAERRKRRNHKLWLHVYDLDNVTAKLNDFMLRGAGMGAFHSGVEVLGDEWFFAWGDTDYTGVLINEPKGHQVHVYKESICMGECPLTEDEIKITLGDAMDAWPANSYHPITRNCVNFAEDLLRRLQAPEPFPEWVRGAPDTGKNPYLYPIADWGWNWVRWYHSEENPPPESQRNSGSSFLCNTAPAQR